MDVNGFIERLFKSELPEGYEFTKVEMNVSAADSQDGGRLFFRGGETAAKVTIEKGNLKPIGEINVKGNDEKPSAYQEEGRQEQEQDEA
jgi:hypothetical protein